MIKARVNRGGAGDPIYVLGLSAENIRRLQASNPILFNAKEIFGVQGTVLFYAGETEESLKADFERESGIRVMAVLRDDVTKSEQAPERPFGEICPR